jgi:hypothetical protein
MSNKKRNDPVRSIWVVEHTVGGRWGPLCEDTGAGGLEHRKTYRCKTRVVLYVPAKGSRRG